MIYIVNPWDKDATDRTYGFRMGEAVLSPTACTVTEEAGGTYRLQMTHPLDPDGKWRKITPLSLVLAPIPPTDIPAFDTSGGAIAVGSEVWTTNSGSTPAYATWQYSYPAFVSGTGYYPGNRVIYQGYVWECVQITLIAPSTSASAWKRISPVRPVLRYLSAGTTLVVTSKDRTNLRCTLLDGTECFVRVNAATYQYTIEEGSEILPDLSDRHLTHQLFRAMDITNDGKAIKVTAQHISYDWSMAIVGQVTLKDTPLATAIAAIRSAVLPDGAASAPNIYAQETDAVVTAACTRKTVTSLILDPEEGLVKQAHARLFRDNLDIFLLNDTETDRGFSIRYGVNMTGVTWRRDFSKLVTRVMPIAKDAQDGDYLLPDVYVDSPHRADYPVDAYQAIVVDAKVGQDGATEADVQAKMTEEAQKIYTEQKADLPATTLTVDFLMMGDTEEFAQYRGLERLNIYDTVEVRHEDIGLITRAQVKSYEWDAISKRYTRITLGDAFEREAHTVYGYNLADGEISARKLTPEAIEQIRNG